MSNPYAHGHDADCICGDCWYPQANGEPLAEWEIQLLQQQAQDAEANGSTA